MKALAKFLPALAATCFAFSSYSRAQLVTYETVSQYAGTSNYSLSSNPTAYSLSNTAGETFTGIVGIQSLTYAFFGSPGADTTLSAKFAAWNGNTSAGGSLNPLNYVTVQDFGTFTVNQFTGVDQNGWTHITNTNGTFNSFEQTFDFGTELSLNATSTYAMLITNQTGSTTNFGIGYAFDSFDSGSAGIGLGSPIQDYTFSQIVVEPAPPVPESSTVASILAALFVAGIVTYRIRQRRQQLAPVAVVAI
ncbi:MAG TPA: hypothetical protein VG710_02910 [Opitutus sp.]|nr:hypothetical protein [Opitutus sp.]